MPAQVHLYGGRHPADLVLALAAHEERGLREVVLGRDRLQRRVVQPALERHHGRRVAGEDPARERVDLEESQLHESHPARRAVCVLAGDRAKSSWARAPSHRMPLPRNEPIGVQQ